MKYSLMILGQLRAISVNSYFVSFVLYAVSICLLMNKPLISFYYEVQQPPCCVVGILSSSTNTTTTSV